MDVLMLFVALISQAGIAFVQNEREKREEARTAKRLDDLESMVHDLLDNVERRLDELEKRTG